MTTFTLGLGVNGALSYTSDYKTPTGDFIGLSNGSLTWPVPGPDNGDTTYTPAERATIDDLWHAAVNGNGTYFSARNPTQLISGIGDTLVQLGDLTGSASTTDLSNTTPVVGDNYAFSARYTKGSWTGNLFARTVNDRAVLSNNAVWCVEQANYVSPPCSPSATTGLYTKVSATADTRTIYANNAGSLVPFKYASLPSTQQGYFNSTYLSTRLSQWGSYTPSQITKINTGAVDGVALVDYLRGQTAFDYRAANDLGTPNDNRFFRQRAAVLGDIVESDPKYMGKAEFDYLDTGYSAYAASTVTRAKSVYVGANDGMLHAFNADTGEERWAFVPTAVMQNMWKLADRDYRNLHANFVNAKMTIGDVYISGAWKTILVSGLGEGGRAYFALDITDPLSPTLLWEFDSTTEPNLGFTYGTPIITKKPDGTWVVIVPSGYNNINDGKGRLFILNPATGVKLANGNGELVTTEGSAATPSGLAQVTAFYNDVIKNNFAKYVYGGDLLGNVWRFDLETNAVFKLTTLVADGVAQPITVQPTLTRINDKRVVVIGTGKLIEPSDLLPTNYKRQSLYVIKDDDLMATVADLRIAGVMVQQTLTGASGSRTGSNNPVDFTTSLGWYADFPNSAATGERQNIRSQVVSGLLIVPTMIPATGTCDTTGKGWYNVFNVKTGALINSTQTTEPIAGFFVTIPANAIAVGDPDYPAGAVDPFIVGAEGVGGVSNRNPGDGLGGNGAFVGNRAVWRELIQ